MSFSILSTTTNKVISRSNLRLVGEPTSPNLTIDPLTTPEVVKTRHLPSDCIDNDEEDHSVAEDESPDS